MYEIDEATGGKVEQIINNLYNSQLRPAFKGIEGKLAVLESKACESIQNDQFILGRIQQLEQMISQGMGGVNQNGGVQNRPDVVQGVQQVSNVALEETLKCHNDDCEGYKKTLTKTKEFPCCLKTYCKACFEKWSDMMGQRAFCINNECNTSYNRAAQKSLESGGWI